MDGRTHTRYNNDGYFELGRLKVILKLFFNGVPQTLYIANIILEAIMNNEFVHMQMHLWSLSFMGRTPPELWTGLLNDRASALLRYLSRQKSGPTGNKEGSRNIYYWSKCSCFPTGLPDALGAQWSSLGVPGCRGSPTGIPSPTPSLLLLPSSPFTPPFPHHQHYASTISSLEDKQ